MATNRDSKSSAIRNFIVIFALLSAIGLFGVRSLLGPNEPTVDKAWGENLRVALADAKKTGKPIVVDFNATWCEPCQEYKNELFNTPEFAQKSKQFELVNVDIDRQPELAGQYRVYYIPDIRVLDSSGNETSKIIGFEPETLLADMDRVLSDGPKVSQTQR